MKTLLDRFFSDIDSLFDGDKSRLAAFLDGTVAQTAAVGADQPEPLDASLL